MTISDLDQHRVGVRTGAGHCISEESYDGMILCTTCHESQNGSCAKDTYS